MTYFNADTRVTISTARTSLSDVFETARIETPKLDARILISHICGISHAEMLSGSETLLTIQQINALNDVTARRINYEPIDHILGYREFYGRRFEINKHVLSPRPETEHMIETALNLGGEQTWDSFIDIGTGSGALAVTLLSERPGAKGLATDISETALKTARINARHHDVNDRLTFQRANWVPELSQSYDLIVSNPPYITQQAMSELPNEVKQFDPALALAGGGDGCAPYRAIAPLAWDALRPNGTLILEIGYDQNQSVTQIIKKSGFKRITCTPDLAGHDRIITAQKLC